MGHTLLIFSIILCTVLLQSCKENYSNGEKVGNLIEFTQKGVIYDSWEGRLNMTQTGMNTSGEPFSFSFDNDRDDQDSIINLMKQAQVNIPLKALVTPSNKNWVFGDLLAHLQEEHTAFTAAKETAHA